ncbi:MAG: rhomboid family intramembrane serine protease [Planctomycetes bacterium]|nr:rhomboid family intramembrane serine protease [Planctomycetota bacterium]
MRSIGTLENETLARRFSDVLLARGIANQVEASPSGSWTVWVEDEDRLKEAAEEYARFCLNPEDPAYLAAHGQAEAIRNVQERKARGERPQMVNVRLRWGMRGPGGVPLTYALIAASVVVGIVSQLGDDFTYARLLLITETGLFEGAAARQPGLPEILGGQVWRVLTPIFLHFGVMHLLFNMWWLHDLGGLVENRLGTLRLALLVLGIAAVSNLAEFFLESPVFGGMSGVVYGLMGYIWMRGRYDPASGLHLKQQDTVAMLIWFVLCWVGLLGPIANVAHTAGLVMGIVWGLVAARRLPFLKGRAGGEA